MQSKSFSCRYPRYKIAKKMTVLILYSLEKTVCSIQRPRISRRPAPATPSKRPREGQKSSGGLLVLLRSRPILFSLPAAEVIFGVERRTGGDSWGEQENGAGTLLNMSAVQGPIVPFSKSTFLILSTRLPYNTIQLREMVQHFLAHLGRSVYVCTMGRTTNEDVWLRRESVELLALLNPKPR